MTTETTITSETVIDKGDLKPMPGRQAVRYETHYRAVAELDDGQWSWHVEGTRYEYGPGGEVYSETGVEDIPEPWTGTPTAEELTTELRGVIE